MTMLGHRPARQSLENTTAEDMMDAILQAKKTEAGVPEDTFENRTKMRQWVQKLRDGGDAARQGVVNDIINEGGGPRVVAGALKMSKMPPANSLFNMLTWQEASKVWDRATPAEKARWRPLFIQKLSRVRPEKTNFPSQTMKDWQAAAAKVGMGQAEE
jgi:hypothetical protein